MSDYEHCWVQAHANNVTILGFPLREPGHAQIFRLSYHTTASFIGWNLNGCRALID